MLFMSEHVRSKRYHSIFQNDTTPPEINKLELRKRTTCISTLTPPPIIYEVVESVHSRTRFLIHLLQKDILLHHKTSSYEKNNHL